MSRLHSSNFNFQRETDASFGLTAEVRQEVTQRLHLSERATHGIHDALEKEDPSLWGNDHGETVPVPVPELDKAHAGGVAVKAAEQASAEAEADRANVFNLADYRVKTVDEACRNTSEVLATELSSGDVIELRSRESPKGRTLIALAANDAVAAALGFRQAA